MNFCELSPLQWAWQNFNTNSIYMESPNLIWWVNLLPSQRSFRSHCQTDWRTWVY